ncbi:MAG: ribosome maturation factor RimM [Alphaproteobacteria bacterium]
MRRRAKRPPGPDPEAPAHGSGAPPDHVAVGAVTGPHGVRGRLRVKPFTARPEDIAAYGPVTTADGRRFGLSIEGAAKGTLIVRIEGVETREAAEALKGAMLYVPREALPEPEEDEFYHADLLGLEAVEVTGERLGRVAAVHDFGAGDLLEIELAAEDRTVLVPFTRDAVPQIDLAAGRLVCDLPEGLLEAGAPHEEEESPP